MATDQHKQALAVLCANVAERHTKGLALLAEARQAPDKGTADAKMDEAIPLLADTALSMDAIVQTATAMATGEVPVGSTETAAEADPAPAVPNVSAETAAAAPASSSDAPASTESTGDYVPADGDASAEDAAATKRKRS
jgi:hypothetical protein